MNRSLRGRCAALLTVLALSAAAVVTTASASNSSSHATSGGTVTFALPPGLAPNSLFPLASPLAVANSSYISIEDFQYLLWRPLYWFGDNGSPGINYRLSLADAPVVSNGGKTVTIQLKHVLWSDGKPVTNRDVEFWMNLLIADKTDYFNYVPGYFPDNLMSESYPSAKPYQFSLTFNKAYSQNWILYNQLSEIIPIPQAEWDRTSATSPVGDYDLTSTGAVSVWNFLSAQNLDRSTYATNPLWHVVDGPWQLTDYVQSSGYSAFTPNDLYFAGKPHVAKFEELPFTSDAAEYDVVVAGGIDYGYLPTVDAAQKRSIESRGYSVVPWVQWGIDFFPINFHNPTVGPIFKQLYIRQAMQHLIDQEQYISTFLDGYGYPTYGPIPLKPGSSYVSSEERSDPFPYSTNAADALLSAHGWKVVKDGISYCDHPGVGGSECGAGIAQGAKLSFTMLYASGSQSLADMMAALQSSFGRAGIRIALSQAPGGEVISTEFGCDDATGAGCGWEMADGNVNGFGWTYSPDYYPTGESLFVPGAVANEGGYNNSTATRYIDSTNTQSGVAVLKKYEDYMTKTLPVLWMPSEYYQLSVIRSDLRGTLPQDPNVQIYPEDWYFSK